MRSTAHPCPEPFVLTVYGLPGPQGSKSFKGISKKTGRAVLVESSSKVKPWRHRVEVAARREMGMDPPMTGPLRVSMVFTLPKPTGAPKRRKTWPIRYPDLSKLFRSTEDALTMAGVWLDDAQVVEYEQSAKRYPGEGAGSLPEPGVIILVRQMASASFLL